MSLLAQLKGATAAQHQQLEQALDLRGTSLSLAGYAALLARMYGFYGH